MINWDEIAGWMGFRWLSQSEGITHSYTLGYRFKDDDKEVWTERFNRFKEKDVPALTGGARLLYAAVPKLIQALDVDVADTVFIAALSSGETTADGDRAVPWITKECAGLVGARFEIAALSKNAHQKIHTFYSVVERNAELDKAEYKSKKLKATNVFVFDDFITRGDTLSRIALSILATNPKSSVYGVALAKNESKPYCLNPSNDHMPSEWDDAWRGGEQEEAEDS
jgi:hypothetical protein